MTLNERLDAIKARLKVAMSAEDRAIALRAVDDLRASGILARVAKVGTRAPGFTLRDATDRPVSLGSLLATGPVVLSFYRGRW